MQTGGLKTVSSRTLKKYIKLIIIHVWSSQTSVKYEKNLKVAEQK